MVCPKAMLVVAIHVDFTLFVYLGKNNLLEKFSQGLEVANRTIIVQGRFVSFFVEWYNPCHFPRSRYPSH